MHSERENPSKEEEGEKKNSLRVRMKMPTKRNVQREREKMNQRAKYTERRRRIDLFVSFFSVDKKQNLAAREKEKEIVELVLDLKAY